MLTMTIDGRDFALSAEDVSFLFGCMHAAMSHKGHRFERTHRSVAGVFRISAGATVRELPAGAQVFSGSCATGPLQTDC